MTSKKPTNDCLVIIPAKGRSRGIPRKNMAFIGGKPLVEYSILAARNAGLPGKNCLSTDDPVIADFATELGIETPFIRPIEFAQDHVSVMPVIEHSLEWYQTNMEFVPDYIVLLQPTNPFRKPENIRKAYRIILSSDADSLISVNKIKNHPCECIIPGELKYQYVMQRPKKSGRQNFPEVFFINGAIYITRTSFFKKAKRLYDERAILFPIGQIEAFDIDEPEDLELANLIYHGLSSKNEKAED